jgi:hypothetical protein
MVLRVTCQDIGCRYLEYHSTNPVLNLSVSDWVMDAIACCVSDESKHATLADIHLARLLLLVLHHQCSNRDLLFHVSTIDVLLARLRQSMRRACSRQVVFLILILLNHFEVPLSQWRWGIRRTGSHCRRILQHVSADSVEQQIVKYQASSNLYHFKNVSQAYGDAT